MIAAQANAEPGSQTAHTLQYLPKVDSSELENSLHVYQKDLAVHYAAIKSLQLQLEEKQRVDEVLSSEDQALFNAKLDWHLSQIADVFYHNAPNILTFASELDGALTDIQVDLDMELAHSNQVISTTVKRHQLKDDNERKYKHLQHLVERCGKDQQAMTSQCKKSVREANMELVLSNREIERFIAHQNALAKVDTVTEQLRDNIEGRGFVSTLTASLSDMHSQLNSAYSLFSSSSTINSITSYVKSLQDLGNSVDRSLSLMQGLSQLPMQLNFSIQDFNQATVAAAALEPETTAGDSINLRSKL